MTELKETESGELVVIKEVDIPALFKEKGCDPIIEGLKKKAAEFEGDISTKKGRDAIKSFARKFSTSKAYIDKLGKALTDKLRDEIAPIQAERNKIEACCDELRDKVRKPLTDYENAEKKRVADIEERINAFDDPMAEFGNRGDIGLLSSIEVEMKLDKINAIIVDESFEEFELAATKAKDAALTQLEAKFIVLQHAEKEKAEADRLEGERLETERKEREGKIAKEAAETATREAKAKTAEKEKKSKQAVIDAKAATETAKREKKEADDKAVKDKKEAAEKAEKEKKAAVEDERKRVAAIKESERIAEEKLAKNKAHRGKLNKEAKQSFIDEGFKAEEAERIIKVIAKGRISNIAINYGA